MKTSSQLLRDIRGLLDIHEFCIKPLLRKETNFTQVLSRLDQYDTKLQRFYVDLEKAADQGQDFPKSEEKTKLSKQLEEYSLVYDDISGRKISEPIQTTFLPLAKQKADDISSLLAKSASGAQVIETSRISNIEILLEQTRQLGFGTSSVEFIDLLGRWQQLLNTNTIFLTAEEAEQVIKKLEEILDGLKDDKNADQRKRISQFLYIHDLVEQVYGLLLTSVAKDDSLGIKGL